MLKGLHNKFKELIAYLVFERSWEWLRFLISSLCELEVNLPLLFDPEFKHLIDRSDIIKIHPDNEEESPAQKLIPKDTLYCEDCVFGTYSKLAYFFYGYQCDGYCYYLGKGDFSFMKPTDLLWDGCKECGINEDIEAYIDEE